MKKIHEEAWTARGHIVRGPGSAGDYSFAASFESPDSYESSASYARCVATARFVSAAPAMARLLVELHAEMKHHREGCACWDCRCRKVLLAAGVLSEKKGTKKGTKKRKKRVKSKGVRP